LIHGYTTIHDGCRHGKHVVGADEQQRATVLPWKVPRVPPKTLQSLSAYGQPDHSVAAVDTSSTMDLSGPHGMRTHNRPVIKTSTLGKIHCESKDFVVVLKRQTQPV